MYPVDLLKVREYRPYLLLLLAVTGPVLMQNLAFFLASQTRMQVLNPSAGGLYTGLSNAFSTITRVEGWRTLWKGLSSVVVGAGTVVSISL